MVGVGGGWFLLEGSSAESGSVTCACLYGSGNSGQTDREKRVDCFPKGTVLSCHMVGR